MNKKVLEAEKPIDENNFVVRNAKANMWVGIIGAVICGALIIYPSDTSALWVYICFSAFFLLGLSLAIWCAVWKIEVTDNEVYLTTPFVRRKAFTFDRITKIKFKGNDQVNRITVYVDEKNLFTVQSDCRGYLAFIKKLESEHLIAVEYV